MNRAEALAILGLNSGASEAEIKKRYRDLAWTYHPDRNPGDRNAEEQFKEALGAYKTLTGETSTGAGFSLASLLSRELERAQQTPRTVPRRVTKMTAGISDYRYFRAGTLPSAVRTNPHPSEEKTDSIQSRLTLLYTEDLGFVNQRAEPDRIVRSRTYAQSLMYGIDTTIPVSSVNDLAEHLAQASTLEQMIAAGTCARSVFRTEYSYGWRDNLTDYIQQWTTLFYALLPHVKDKSSFPDFAKLASIAQGYTKQKFGASLPPPPQAIREAAKIIVSALRPDFGLAPAINILSAAKRCLYHRIAGMRRDIAKKMGPVWSARDKLLDDKKYSPADIEALFNIINLVEDERDVRIIISSVDKYVKYIDQLTSNIEKDELPLARNFVAALAKGGRGYESEQSRQQCDRELIGIVRDYLPYYKENHPLFDRSMSALSRLKYDSSGKPNTRPKSITIPLSVAAFAGRMIVEETKKHPNPSEVIALVHEVCSGFAHSELYPGRKQREEEIVLVNELSQNQQTLYTNLAQIQGSARRVTLADIQKLVPLLF